MYTSLAILSGLLITVVLVGRRYDALSHLSTAYLRFIYPIKSADKREDLPTLPFVWPNGQGNIEKYLRGRENSAKWGEQYGSIYRIWSGFHGEIILTTPTDIETVFRDSHTHLKANANDSGHYMYRLLGICLGLISGSDWRSLRKATENPFTRTATTSYVDAVMNHAKLHVESLRGSKPEKWHLKPIQDLRIYPFLALADILYGTLTPELKARLLQMIPLRDSVFAHMIMGGVTRYAWARHLPLKANREMGQFKAQWAQWNDDAHAEALRRQNNSDGKDSHDNSAPIVAMYAAAKEGMTSYEALYQTLDEMLFANLDVSIGALAWSMTFIAAHKHVQTRLLSEIDAALRDPEATSSYLLSQSNYLHHIILEGARLRPVAAFSVAQACPTARQVGPYILPAGSKFVVDAYALNVRDPLWAPDNTTFRPERWAEGGVQRAKDVRYCYWRFGFGPRVCLGKYVVDLMMKALIVEVLRGAEVRLEDAQGGEWKWEQDTWALPPELRIACVKR